MEAISSSETLVDYWRTIPTVLFMIIRVTIILGGKGRPAREADNLTAIREPIIEKMWEPRRLTTLWAFRACYRDYFTIWNDRLTFKVKCLLIRGK
jgi:hypothetical protein